MVNPYPGLKQRRAWEQPRFHTIWFVANSNAVTYGTIMIIVQGKNFIVGLLYLSALIKMALLSDYIGEKKNGLRNH